MNPIAIVKQGTGELVGYQCATCGDLVRGDASYAREIIERCCNPSCEDCGGPKKMQGARRCGACETAREEKHWAERFAKASKTSVKEYGGEMLYFQNESIGQNGYVVVSDLEDALERFVHAHPNEEVPGYAWATIGEMASIDLSEVIDSALADNHHEGAPDFVNWKLVKIAQDALTLALEEVETFFEDTTRALLLDGVVLFEGEPNEMPLNSRTAQAEPTPLPNPHLRVVAISPEARDRKYRCEECGAEGFLWEMIGVGQRVACCSTEHRLPLLPDNPVREQP